jgi:hypothetical protein
VGKKNKNIVDDIGDDLDWSDSKPKSQPKLQWPDPVSKNSQSKSKAKKG